jgi:hypothetical protein
MIYDMVKKKRHVPYHENRPVVIISVIGLILASLVFLQLKGMPTGYAVYDFNRIEVGEILKGDDTLSIATVDGSGLPIGSVEISGQVIGEGAASVYLQSGGKWLLVFSNRDDFTRPGFMIVGPVLKEKVIESDVVKKDNLLRIKINGVEKPELANSDIWDVPSTCWESCRIFDYGQDELLLYFDIEDGTGFFLDKVTLA